MAPPFSGNTQIKLNGSVPLPATVELPESSLLVMSSGLPPAPIRYNCIEASSVEPMPRGKVPIMAPGKPAFIASLRALLISARVAGDHYTTGEHRKIDLVADIDDIEAMNFIVDKLNSTENNGEFFDLMRRGG